MVPEVILTFCAKICTEQFLKGECKVQFFLAFVKPLAALGTNVQFFLSNLHTLKVSICTFFFSISPFGFAFRKNTLLPELRPALLLQCLSSLSWLYIFNILRFLFVLSHINVQYYTLNWHLDSEGCTLEPAECINLRQTWWHCRNDKLLPML